jgi:hypothetical protein
LITVTPAQDYDADTDPTRLVSLKKLRVTYAFFIKSCWHL